MKMKLNNLMIQLRKNCAHPDLFNAAFDSTSVSHNPIERVLFVLHSMFLFANFFQHCCSFVCLQAFIHLPISFWNNVVNFSCLTGYWNPYSNKSTRFMVLLYISLYLSFTLHSCTCQHIFHELYPNSIDMFVGSNIFTVDKSFGHN